MVVSGRVDPVKIKRAGLKPNVPDIGLSLNPAQNMQGILSEDLLAGLGSPFFLEHFSRMKQHASPLAGEAG